MPIRSAPSASIEIELPFGKERNKPDRPDLRQTTRQSVREIFGKGETELRFK
jgi:hypothetical protein